MAGQYVTTREARFIWTFLALYVQCSELYALAVDIIEVSTNFFRGISRPTLYLSVCFIAAIFILDLRYRPRDFSDRT